MVIAQTDRSSRRVLLYFCTNSFAETLQAVGILWATFALTHSATLVGVVNAAAYIPGVVVGLVFARHADSGDANRRLSQTNWVLVIGSSTLVAVWALSGGTALVIGFFVAAQISLSIVKMLNKAYVGRFVRNTFDNDQAKRVLERSASFGLVGGLVGGAAGGLLLEVTSASWTFAGAAVLYLVSLAAVRLVLLRTANNPPTVDPGATRDPDDGDMPDSEGTPTAANRDRRRFLWLILLFSIPSSGALPYISTLLVPYADAVAPGSGVFYAVLTIAATTGGFVAGMALSTERLSMRHILAFGLIAGAVGCALLGAVTWAPLVVALVFAASTVITTHVISMQVLTNQAPPRNEVGRFTVLRNCVAGLAKGLFSLAAGWVVDTGGTAVAWVALAVALVVFSIGWSVITRTRRHREFAL